MDLSHQVCGMHEHGSDGVSARITDSFWTEVCFVGLSQLPAGLEGQGALVIRRLKASILSVYSLM